MANHLENLADRLEQDPFFLACPLKLYAISEGLNEERLAAALKCSGESLLQVRLCRAPAADEESFADEIERIASRFGTDANVLLEAVRRGQAIFHLGQGETAAGTLLAARDAETQAAPDTREGDKQ